VLGIPYYATAAAIGRDHCAQFDQICCIAGSDSAVTYLIKYGMCVRVCCGVALHIIGQPPRRITAIALTAIRTTPCTHDVYSKYVYELGTEIKFNARHMRI
jgi:hypothetical protein